MPSLQASAEIVHVLKNESAVKTTAPKILNKNCLRLKEELTHAGRPGDSKAGNPANTIPAAEARR